MGDATANPVCFTHIGYYTTVPTPFSNPDAGFQCTARNEHLIRLSLHGNRLFSLFVYFSLELSLNYLSKHDISFRKP